MGCLPGTQILSQGIIIAPKGLVAFQRRLQRRHQVFVLQVDQRLPHLSRLRLLAGHQLRQRAAHLVVMGAEGGHHCLCCAVAAGSLSRCRKK
jgi:hypothetical protein